MKSVGRVQCSSTRCSTHSVQHASKHVIIDVVILQPGLSSRSAALTANSLIVSRCRRDKDVSQTICGWRWFQNTDALDQWQPVSSDSQPAFLLWLQLRCSPVARCLFFFKCRATIKMANVQRLYTSESFSLVWSVTTCGNSCIKSSEGAERWRHNTAPGGADTKTNRVRTNWNRLIITTAGVSSTSRGGRVKDRNHAADYTLK